MPDKKNENEDRWKLLEARRAYGWGYFDFHAKQRTTMFNFYLVFTGFVINGFAAVVKEHMYVVSLFLAFLGVGSSIIFLCLDRRNEEFVHVAEDVLRAVEEDVLFRKEKRKTRCPRRRSIFGVMEEDDLKVHQTGIFLREEADIAEFGPSPYRHGLWIPIFLLSMAGAYILGMLYSLYQLLCI